MVPAILSALYSDRPSQKPSHYHDCHQILFVTGGSAQVLVDGKRYDAREGDLVLFSRFEQHSVTAGSEGYCRYVLQLDPRLPAAGEARYRLFSILYNRPAGFRHVLPTGDSAPEFVRLFRQILEEQSRQLPLSQEMLELLLQQLMVSVCRCCPQPPALAEGCYETVSSIQSRLERDYRERLSLEALAGEFGLSASYLSHLFKRVTGTSVMGYLQSCRLAAAKRCLAQTSMSIGQIVESCGFSDSSNFSRLFRSANGCTPSRFRELHRE